MFSTRFIASSIAAFGLAQAQRRQQPTKTYAACELDGESSGLLALKEIMRMKRGSTMQRIDAVGFAHDGYDWEEHYLALTSQCVDGSAGDILNDDLWDGEADRHGSLIFESRGLIVDGDSLTSMVDNGYGLALLDEDEQVQSCCQIELIQESDYQELMSEIWEELDEIWDEREQDDEDDYDSEEDDGSSGDEDDYDSEEEGSSGDEDDYDSEEEGSSEDEDGGSSEDEDDYDSEEEGSDTGEDTEWDDSGDEDEDDEDEEDDEDDEDEEDEGDEEDEEDQEDEEDEGDEDEESVELRKFHEMVALRKRQRNPKP